jgi:hypothetical protein
MADRNSLATPTYNYTSGTYDVNGPYYANGDVLPPPRDTFVGSINRQSQPIGPPLVDPNYVGVQNLPPTQSTSGASAYRSYVSRSADPKAYQRKLN